jgi:hypothetical protein
MAYHRVEKPRFLFLEGSTGAEAAVDVATVALPNASAARASTSTARVASSVDRPAAGASAPAPGACSSAASAALGEGGACSHLSGGPAPRHSPPPLPHPTTNTPRSPGKKVSTARTARILRPSAPGVPAAGSFAPSCAPPAPTAAAALHARSGSGRRRVGPRGVHGYPMLGRVKRQNHDGASRGITEKGENHSPTGHREA